MTTAVSLSTKQLILKRSGKLSLRFRRFLTSKSLDAYHEPTKMKFTAFILPCLMLQATALPVLIQRSKCEICFLLHFLRRVIERGTLGSDDVGIDTGSSNSAVELGARGKRAAYQPLHVLTTSSGRG